MITVLTIVNNASLYRKIEKTLKKINVRVVNCDRKYASFLKAAQYAPAAILIQVNELSRQELSLINLIGRNPSAERRPLILFGPAAPERFKKAVRRIGADAYLDEPLSIRELLMELQTCLRSYFDREKEKMRESIGEENSLEKKYIDTLMDPSVLATKKIALMVDHIESLVAFPTTFAVVLKLTEEKTSSASQLGRAIESDPSVATEILRLANSVYFAARDKRIDDLRQAIVRIGFNQTKTAVLSMSVMNQFKDSNFATGFQVKEFWFHSLAVAVIAKRLAKKTDLVRPDEAFAFALLHELGVLLFNEYMNDAFLKILHDAAETGSSFTEHQRRLMGVTHLDLLGELFEQWKLSGDFYRNIRVCDTLSGTSRDLSRYPLAAVTAAADAVAHSLRIGFAADCTVLPLGEPVLKEFGFSADLRTSFREHIYHEINMYNSIMKIDHRTYPLAGKEAPAGAQLTIMVLCGEQPEWNPVVEYCRSLGYRILRCFSSEDIIEAYEESSRSAVLLVPSYATFLEDAVITAGEEEIRTLLFEEAEQFPREYEYIVSAIYPVDLRNVAMVLESFFLDVSGDTAYTHTEYRYLLPVSSEKSEVSSLGSAFISFSNASVKEGLMKILREYSFTLIEECENSTKAENMIRSAGEDISYFFIEKDLYPAECEDHIGAIKKMPRHKGARYIVFYYSQKPQVPDKIRLLNEVSAVTTINLGTAQDLQTLRKMLEQTSGSRPV
ncbi:MAG: HDOD domain-containing protein [Fibrobacterota bacterium]